MPDCCPLGGRRWEPNRIELYTEPFARAFASAADAGQRSFQRYVDAANLAHGLGLGVNAGHDLDLFNLTLFRIAPSPR